MDFDFEELIGIEPKPTPKKRKPKQTAKDKIAASKKRVKQSIGHKTVGPRRGSTLDKEVRAIIDRQAVGVQIEENKQLFLPSMDDAQLGNEIARMIVDGKSIPYICETLHIDKKDIRRLVDMAAQAIQEESGHLILNFISTSLMRYERMIEVNMEHISYLDEQNNRRPNLEVQGAVKALIEGESALIQMALPKKNDGASISITNTINTNGHLYQEARERMFTRRPEPEEFDDLISGDDIIIFPERHSEQNV